MFWQKGYCMKNTKEKLLENATQMFAEYGFDGVSTRDLVAMSGVNLCTINYYFGSKQKLYDAVIDKIIMDVKTSFVDRLDYELENHNMSSLNQLLFAIGSFFDYVFSDKISNAMSLITIREFLMPLSSGNKIYTEILGPLKTRAAKLIMDITGWDKTTADIQAHCMVGQIMSFKVHQNAVRYTRNFLQDVKQQILENCKTLLSDNKLRGIK